MKIQIWGFSLKSEVVAQSECWADVLHGGSRLELSGAANGACLHLACLPQCTAPLLNFNTPGQIHSRLICLAPVFM